MQWILRFGANAATLGVSTDLFARARGDHAGYF